jgi:hypothetical protein
MSTILSQKYPPSSKTNPVNPSRRLTAAFQQY